jgi:hypothetical protein
VILHFCTSAHRVYMMCLAVGIVLLNLRSDNVSSFVVFNKIFLITDLFRGIFEGLQYVTSRRFRVTKHLVR